MSEQSLPPIPEKYKDRVLGGNQQSVDATQVTAHSRKPIAIMVSAQDVARWYVDKLSPYDFTQKLLERFKAAGVPVEWSPRGLRLIEGRIAKARMNPAKQDEFFRYVWLSNDYCRALAASDGRN